MRSLKNLLILGLLAVIFAAGYIYSGHYPVAADVPHNQLTYWVLDTLRERSVSMASRDIAVPDLDNVDLLLQGGPDYHEMCESCHLQPGKAHSDLSLGLYPAPPNLSLDGDEHGHSHAHGKNDSAAGKQLARQQFWVIKHGIKASAMPAWGLTHDDERIWAMVAFLQQLPDMTAEQYQVLTTRDESIEHAEH